MAHSDRTERGKSERRYGACRDGKSQNNEIRVTNQIKILYKNESILNIDLIQNKIRDPRAYGIKRYGVNNQSWALEQMSIRKIMHYESSFANKIKAIQQYIPHYIKHLESKQKRDSTNCGISRYRLTMSHGHELCLST